MATSNQSLSAELLARVCEVVDAFDAAWQAVADGATPPRIEAALHDIPEAEQPAFLRELLGVELECRLRFGEQPTADEYLSRFLQHAELVEAVVSEVRYAQVSLALTPQTSVDESDLARRDTSGVATDGLSLVAIHSVVQPSRFGDFELLSEIARGGMGVVYKARQVSLNRIVAFKMILAGKLASPHDVERFQTEAQAAANLDHPGIVQVYGVGEIDGRHYYSMAFVDGQSLAKRVADGPLPPREAAEIVRQVAEAVQYAHEHGVIHRDLKPANILLANGRRQPPGCSPSSGTSPEGLRPPFADMIPKITDFGLAKQLDADSSLTNTGQILGTPSYMPPEQAQGRTRDIGPQSDVYSLGAILYCLLSGRPPFQAATVLETLQQVIDAEPVSLRQVNAAIPADLETLCHKCLSKEPNRRYLTARELAEELTRFLNGESIHARPASRLERAGRWCRRNPAVASLSAAVVLVLLTGVAVSSFFAFQSAARNRNLLKETVRANQKSMEASEKAALALANAAKERKQKERADEERRQAELARDQAKLKELEAVTTATFLKNLFRTSDLLGLEGFGFQSTGQRGTDLTAREILDLGAKRVEAELPNVLVRAAMYDTLGNVYRSLGLLNQAEPLLIKSLEIRERELGAEHEDVAESLRSLGWLKQDIGDFGKAEELYYRALRIQQKRLGMDHLKTADTLQNLSWVIAHQFGEITPERMEEAEHHLRECLRIRKLRLSQNDRQIGLTLVGLVALKLGRNLGLKDVIADLTAALAILDKSGDVTGRCLVNYTLSTTPCQRLYGKWNASTKPRNFIATSLNRPPEFWEIATQFR